MDWIWVESECWHKVAKAGDFAHIWLESGPTTALENLSYVLQYGSKLDTQILSPIPRVLRTRFQHCRKSLHKKNSFLKTIKIPNLHTLCTQKDLSKPSFKVSGYAPAWTNG